MCRFFFTLSFVRLKTVEPPSVLIRNYFVEWDPVIKRSVRSIQVLKSSRNGRPLPNYWTFSI